MATYFEITSGMPAPMARNVVEMHFAEEGSGGWLGFSLPSTQRNIVLIHNDVVVSMFRTHLVRVGARFTESPDAPRGSVIRTIEVPTMMQAAAERIKAQIHKQVGDALNEEAGPRPKRRRRQ